MPIRSKFLSGRAISNEEFERRQQISESLVSDLADSLRAPVSTALDESLRQTLNDDWLVPAHMLLLELAGTENRPTLAEVRHGLDSMLQQSSTQLRQGQVTPTLLDQCNREVAMDAAAHLLAKWHAFVRERIIGKGTTAIVFLNSKLAPIDVRSWSNLLSPERLARWSLKPEDLDPVFERFASLLERRLADDQLPVGGGLYLGRIRLATKMQLVLTSGDGVVRDWRNMVSQLSGNPRVTSKAPKMYVARRDRTSTTEAMSSSRGSKMGLKMMPVEYAVHTSLAGPDSAANLAPLLSDLYFNSKVARQCLPSGY
ncbi:MAG: hypothetical protein L6414_16740 [Hydrogenophaga sp.]|uniref:hypothetical protein n=1 Tax=Hydrogenophaga sp. TaxID=1904254 RepID=UPI0025C61562|nr:hypothetical protein [Hydrogenophaga sp.]MCG2657091.1 hypothetical protein [Hydrogenophaga sp.]